MTDKAYVLFLNNSLPFFKKSSHILRQPKYRLAQQGTTEEKIKKNKYEWQCTDFAISQLTLHLSW